MKLKNDEIELNFFIQNNNNFRLATSENNTLVGFFWGASSNIQLPAEPVSSRPVPSPTPGPDTDSEDGDTWCLVDLSHWVKFLALCELGSIWTKEILMECELMY